MDWPESVRKALIRSAKKHNASTVTRQTLIAEELDRIVFETGSDGKTPDQTLSRILQDLRKEKFIEFTGRGKYRIFHSKPKRIISIDINEPSPTERIELITTRIVRDTKIVIRLKALYKNQCQICGLALNLGSRHYSEGHHIRPLGQPHSGPDHEKNIIIVCPNHHVCLDFGAIKLDLSKLKLNKHNINKLFVDYHNKELFESRQNGV